VCVCVCGVSMCVCHIELADGRKPLQFVVKIVKNSLWFLRLRESGGSDRSVHVVSVHYCIKCPVRDPCSVSSLVYQVPCQGPMFCQFISVASALSGTHVLSVQ